MSVPLEHILGWCWFSSRGKHIGIIVSYSPIEEKLKAYIGTHLGMGEKLDGLFIANHGAKFPVTEAISIIKQKGNYNLSTDYKDVLIRTFNLDMENEK